MPPQVQPAEQSNGRVAEALWKGGALWKGAINE